MVTTLEEKFIAYQCTYIDVIKELTSGYNNNLYQDWRGFITLDGPIIERPAILFIGINPGPGLYNETNCDSTTRLIPFRILYPEKYNSALTLDSRLIVFRETVKRSDKQTIALDWYTKGNYDGRLWYEATSKNSFVGNMIKIICEVARLKYKKPFVKGTRPEWYDNDEFGKNIMHLNLYPIATENTGGLDRILRTLNKNVSITPLRKLVKEINPQVIVFEGKRAYDSFMGSDKREELDDLIISTEYSGIPVVAFRRGVGSAWNSSENLNNIAARIYKYIK